MLICPNTVSLLTTITKYLLNKRMKENIEMRMRHIILRSNVVARIMY
jgi:hypothetical protein